MKNYSSMKRLAVSLSLILAGVAVVPAAVAAPQAAIAPTQIQLNSLSFDQLQQAAQAGDPDAQYALGYMYYYGKNVQQDSAQALNWIKRAAVQGQAEAVKALALLDPGAASRPAMNVATAQQAAPVSSPSDGAPIMTGATVDAASTAATPAADDTVATATNDKSAKNTKAPSSQYYTIQIRASASKQDLVNYAKAHHLQAQAVYAQTKHKGKNWYTLQYGVYKTKPEAQAAMAKLPSAVRKAGPWVKAVGKNKSK